MMNDYVVPKEVIEKMKFYAQYDGYKLYDIGMREMARLFLESINVVYTKDTE